LTFITLHSFVSYHQ